MKYYYISNEQIQDYLEENGIIPLEYRDRTAVYKCDPKLFSSLLDSFYIKHSICKTHI